MGPSQPTEDTASAAKGGGLPATTSRRTPTGGERLTCWEQGFPPGGKATGKCRARWGGTSRFFFRTAFSQCAVTHLFLSFIACRQNSAACRLGLRLQAG